MREIQIAGFDQRNTPAKYRPVVSRVGALESGFVPAE
jgi:hypothetical protein